MLINSLFFLVTKTAKNYVFTENREGTYLLLLNSDILADGCWHELGQLGKAQREGIVERCLARELPTLPRMLGHVEAGSSGLRSKGPHTYQHSLCTLHYFGDLVRLTSSKPSMEEEANTLVWVKEIAEPILPPCSEALLIRLLQAQM